MNKLAATLFVALLAVMVSAPLVSAQDSMSQGTMGQGNTSEITAKLEKMAAALQLTPAQKKQIAPILMEEAPKLKALKADTSLGPMQKGMQLRQISEATDAKLQPILTPEQNQKLQAMRAQERQQMMQKMENH